MIISEAMRRSRRAGQYATKFIVENKERGTLNDLSDLNLERSFKGCVIPLKPEFYDDCREAIKEILEGASE